MSPPPCCAVMQMYLHVGHHTSFQQFQLAAHACVLSWQVWRQSNVCMSNAYTASNIGSRCSMILLYLGCGVQAARCGAGPLLLLPQALGLTLTTSLQARKAPKCRASQVCASASASVVVNVQLLHVLFCIWQGCNAWTFAEMCQGGRSPSRACGVAWTLAQNTVASDMGVGGCRR